MARISGRNRTARTLNDTAEEELATDDLFSPNFARPNIFTDPRRAMFGVKLNVGRE